MFELFPLRLALYTELKINFYCLEKLKNIYFDLTVCHLGVEKLL